MEIKSVLTDFPEQFKKGQNFNALCRAFDNQFKAITDTLEQIMSGTNIETATGKQLDMIGDIVGLTRAEAGLLCGQTIYFDVVDDDRYRKYLKYKALRNSSDGTYYSLITALKAILGSSAEIQYTEDPNYPATIILDINTGAGDNIYLVYIPPIRPAGVNVEYKIDAKATIEVSHEVVVSHSDYIFCGTHFCGTYPPKE